MANTFPVLTQPIATKVFFCSPDAKTIYEVINGIGTLWIKSNDVVSNILKP